eukprot:5883033-Pleurochrysis_carterae.AAC.1
MGPLQFRCSRRSCRAIRPQSTASSRARFAHALTQRQRAGGAEKQSWREVEGGRAGGHVCA